MRVLVTGANGFIGRTLCQQLVKTGLRVSASVRSPEGKLSLPDITDFVVGDITAHTDWGKALANNDALIHLAARVHTMQDSADDSLDIFRTTNVQGTINLAKQAANAGIKRFVYVSSIKVNGESSATPFSHNQVAAPEEPYAISKQEAEIGLKELSQKLGLEIVIIRPPLVYGPGVKGNIQTLAKMIKRGNPLPLGMVNNRRSLISVYNLVDLMRVCLTNPHAAGQTFLASDDRTISTKQLVKYLSKGLQRKVVLLPVPIIVLKTFASFLGKAELVNRLAGDLEVDISYTKHKLDWVPPYTVEESFSMMFHNEECTKR
ncbi:SDR family oxidoreductase [Exilibacterium tricleocarpae]|uniref:SDR family oxidoreductase n=1 Tax=Exilibacterium tricleocarpae TaxID=2591008 RepID=A0A545U463_9GAMM|nr:SDR family oxidoreductase [Exilibacterium tricleocarpae]TQV84234.1 SDR family oxidoreductase [Exilibacterium tricleocarpae]